MSVAKNTGEGNTRPEEETAKWAEEETAKWAEEVSEN
jgi:hypothetical protein